MQPAAATDQPTTAAHEPEPMVAARPRGRIFSIERRPLLGDCAPSGRVRLDALARWLQDVAYADVEDAGLHLDAVWVLRRTRIQVNRFPRFADHCTVQTFCSGTGPMWAERRTTVTAVGETEPLVEGVALWVHLDPVERLPIALTKAELDVFGEAVGDRHVHARLRHGRPNQIESESEWWFRRTDSDVADHVNNAAYWEPLEDELLAAEPDLVEVDAEIEFRNAAQPGATRILISGPRRWIADPRGDEVYASLVVLSARRAPADTRSSSPPA
jgi:acyl-ACP thioesterase